MPKIQKYDPEEVEVLNGAVATLPVQNGMRYMKSNFMTVEIIRRKRTKQFSFVVHNPYYGTTCEADWMDEKDLLPALREMQATFEVLIKELEDDLANIEQP